MGLLRRKEKSHIPKVRDHLVGYTRSCEEKRDLSSMNLPSSFSLNKSSIGLIIWMSRFLKMKGSSVISVPSIICFKDHYRDIEIFILHPDSHHRLHPCT